MRGGRRAERGARSGASAARARSSAASRAALGHVVGLCRCSPTFSSPNRHRLHQPLRSGLPRRRVAERRTAADGLAGTCGAMPGVARAAGTTADRHDGCAESLATHAG